MGLIKAIMGAAGGVLADQWVDFFTCDSMNETVLMRPGVKNTNARSSNTKGTPDIITNGSKINVADGQCMLIVEDGKVVEFCAEPGQYTYNNTVAPSLLGGGFKDLGASFAQVGKRFTAGGGVLNQQKVYYINTKEIIGNKIGWGNIPFRDSEFQMTVRVQGFGQYSFRITNPLLFYTNNAGNTTGEYRRDDLTSQMKAEVIAALNPALGRIAQQKIAYDMLINYPKEIGEALNAEMSAEWSDLRGIQIVKMAMESVTVDDASAKKIEQLQEARAMSNPMMAGGRIAAAQATAMEQASANQGGAMPAFMAMGMAQNQGGMNAQNLFAMGQQQAADPSTSGVPQVPQMPAQPEQPILKTAPSWTCACGAVNTAKFCQECGEKKPEPAASGSWTCACGAVNTGKFCQECGAKQTVAEPAKCNGCNWVAPDLETRPKFCPECGTKM